MPSAMIRAKTMPSRLKMLKGPLSTNGSASNATFTKPLVGASIIIQPIVLARAGNM